MHNLIKCTNCSKMFIGEEYQEHQTKCVSKVKEIAITFLVQVDKSDKQVFIAKGLDGILYRLVKVLSDDFLQGDKNKQNRRGLDRTVNNNLQIHPLILIRLSSWYFILLLEKISIL
jgi:LYAR-type C2HC zinc finger